ncbi:MAG TPA: hypothetical protein DDW30_00345 [Clostridiales bacterium]|nr:hypothetical protein [Clostridiales bacterium]
MPALRRWRRNMYARRSDGTLPTLLMIAGLPASGKSTVARRLAGVFGMPVLEKDDLKEALFDTVGFRNYPEKRQLDVAANAVLLRAAGAVLDAGNSLCMVNNFRADMESGVREFLAAHPCRAGMLFLTGDADVFWHRYAERDRVGARHIAHALPDHYPLLSGEPMPNTVMSRERFREVFENLGMADFRVDCPSVCVDVTDPNAVNFDALTDRVSEMLGITKGAEHE